MTSIPFYFIRHGETDWNAEKRYQGQTDIPLNDTGRAQAHRNGVTLAAYFAENGIDTAELDFVASPLGRTRETMRLVREGLGLPVDDFALDARLMEISYGLWEGNTIPELDERLPGEVARRRASRWAYRPPEGETYAELTARVEEWLGELRRPAVVVAHGGTSRVLRGLLLDVEPDDIPILDVPQDKVFVWRGTDYLWI
ncbi:MAG: histidine phosphatase family protein [Hyphomicrobiales bacterium]|nr:MAG: histidine phosphatase family protein [Hyphomicrobiales bacterium]